MRVARPSRAHEERRQFLDDVAFLSGYTLAAPQRLPDGSCPDVFRLDPRCGAFFLGDAKETESPGGTETGRRLRKYLSWLVAIAGPRLRGTAFAVCFGTDAHIDGWMETLRRLALEAGVGFLEVHAGELDDDLFVVWLCQDRGTQMSRSLSRPSETA